MIGKNVKSRPTGKRKDGSRHTKTERPNQEIIDETLRSLAKYPMPLIRGFLKEVKERHKLKVRIGGPKNDVLRRIRTGVKKQFFPPIDLLNYDDRLKETGFQHVFLFRLSEQYREYLKDLRNPEFIRKQLADKKLAHCYNTPQIIWDAETPQLAAVLQRSGPQESILFKWVETRIWREQVKMGVDAAGFPVFKLVPRRERSVNFFRVNLTNGESILSLERMHPNSKNSLRAEWELYCERIRELVRFDYFRPVLLEPVIRSLLTSGVIKIRRWNVTLPGGGRLMGKGDPTLFQKLGLWFRDFVGTSLGGFWHVNGNDSKIRIALDGKKDAITIFRHAGSEQRAKILQKIMRSSNEKIVTPELKNLAPADGRRHGALKKLDVHLSELKEHDVDVKRLMSEEWIAYDNVVEILKDASTKFPKVFRVTYQILCPETNRPIQNASGPIQFDNPDQIPALINCDHPYPIGKVTHPTEGNIRPLLRFESPPPAIMSEGIIKWIDKPKGLVDFFEKHLGQMMGRTSIKALGLLLFTALYAGLALIIAEMFLSLIEKYVSHQVLATMPYFIVLLLLVVLILAIFGPETVEKAVSVLAKIILGSKTVENAASFFGIIIKTAKMIYSKLFSRSK